MFFHKTGMLFLYVCFCHKHEEYNYEYCLFWQCFYPIYIGFLMFDAKELIQNSIPVLTKNIESVLIPCFMLNHIKYMHSNFTIFGARSRAKLCPMFWHQTLINACSVSVVVVSFGSLHWCQGSCRGFGVLCS